MSLSRFERVALQKWINAGMKAAHNEHNNENQAVARGSDRKLRKFTSVKLDSCGRDASKSRRWGWEKPRDKPTSNNG